MVVRPWRYHRVDAGKSKHILRGRRLWKERGLKQKEQGSKVSRKSRSLRSLVIDPFTQMKLGVYVIAFTAIFLVSAGWLYYNSFVEQYRHVMQIFEITDPDTQWEAISNDVFYTNLYKIGGLFSLFSMALLAVIFRVTHRYHGPLVSIERFATNMSNGQYYRRVQIRKKD